MQNRKLNLKRETLAELSPAEMPSVAGGSHACGPTDNCTHLNVDTPCPSNPLTHCLPVVTVESLPCL